MKLDQQYKGRIIEVHDNTLLKQLIEKSYPEEEPAEKKQRKDTLENFEVTGCKFEQS